ncbi:hypothetical protein E9993_19885 [Labilibacter sediminis]|nr:hypothetical protein E9993_19885 [Labilibacter sediminis]
MKKSLLVLFTVLLSVSAFSQKKQQYELTAEKVVKTWVEVCDLDVETEKALLPIMVEKQKETFEARNTHKGDKEAFKEAEKAIGKKYYIQIKEVVGQDNVKKMGEHWKAQRNK